MVVTVTYYSVSVIITTYKRKWSQIERALNSVLSQTYPVNEIIIVDDNHPNSIYRKDIKENLKNLPEIIYIEMPQNGGVAKARNTGLKYASNDLVAFLDDDDEWLPDKIRKQVILFNKYDDTGLVFGQYDVINDVTKEKHPAWQQEIFKAKPTRQQMLCRDYVGSASNPLINARAIKKLGGFAEENQPAEEDYEMWIRIAMRYRIYGMSDVVVLKHMDGDEHVSQNKRKNYEGFINIYKRHHKNINADLEVQTCMLWNIARFAVKSRSFDGIPYIIKWFFTKILWKTTGR